MSTDDLRVETEPLLAEQLGFQVKPSKNLCHYTTQNGLIGILRNKVIYATDATYLSDSQEMAYSISLAKRYFKNKSPGTGTRDILNMLNVLDQTETLVGKLPIYVASFSEEPDLLSQWRGYCPKGSGFSLCVSPSRMMTLAVRYKWTVFKCIYDEAEQIEVLKKMEQYALDSFAKLSTVPKEFVFGITLLSFGIAFKHPKFKEESEWRVIQRAGGTASIRPGASTLVPYVDFPLTTDVKDSVELAALVVGPTPHQILAKKAAQTLLQLTNTTCPEPVSSEVPFRNW